MKPFHSSIFFCVLVFFQATQNTLASPFPFSGRIYSDHYLYSNSGNLAQSSFSLWLDLDSKTTTGMGARFIGEADLLAKSVEHPSEFSAFAQMREAYVSYLSEGIDLKIGQQLIPWGKSDGINPTDYFTAKNYLILNPDDEAKRLGAPAINISFTPSQGSSAFTFQWVFQAYYPQTRLNIPDILIPKGIAFRAEPKPPTAFHTDSMEYGAKLAYQKSSYDVSISAFHGYGAIPEFQFDRTLGRISSINIGENAFGSDASVSIGDSIVRFESAFHFPENGGEHDPLFGFVEPPHWDSVLGFEKPILTDFRLQFQFLFRHHLYYQDSVMVSSGNPVVDQIMTGVARANAILLNYQNRSAAGTTLRISYLKENSKWTAGLLIIGYFTGNQDFLMRPELGFNPFENFKMLLGFDLYGGNPSGTLGSLQSKSDAFFEGKYLF